MSYSFKSRFYKVVFLISEGPKGETGPVSGQERLTASPTLPRLLFRRFLFCATQGAILCCGTAQVKAEFITFVLTPLIFDPVIATFFSKVFQKHFWKTKRLLNVLL